MRILILCTHNSARSQIAEGWARHHAQAVGLEADIWSAGTEATRVKEDAKTVMLEVGIDLGAHSSKTLSDLPDAQNFDYVITVCDSAAANCPVYQGKTTRLHYPFTDPSGSSLQAWRTVRDQIGVQMKAFIVALEAHQTVPPSYTDSPSVGV